ncbi:hypothetical protein ANO11243_068380 [Dothideomycetidae sp. 11243]|nr:hypothetical protein ANO11243_068380 [fungal sp. No.11243]
MVTMDEASIFVRPTVTGQVHVPERASRLKRQILAAIQQDDLHRAACFIQLSSRSVASNDLPPFLYSVIKVMRMSSQSDNEARLFNTLKIIDICMDVGIELMRERVSKTLAETITRCAETYQLVLDRIRDLAICPIDQHQTLLDLKTFDLRVIHIRKSRAASPASISLDRTIVQNALKFGVAQIRSKAQWSALNVFNTKSLLDLIIDQLEPAISKERNLAEIISLLNSVAPRVVRPGAPRALLERLMHCYVRLNRRAFSPSDGSSQQFWIPRINDEMNRWISAAVQQLGSSEDIPPSPPSQEPQYPLPKRADTFDALLPLSGQQFSDLSLVEFATQKASVQNPAGKPGHGRGSVISADNPKNIRGLDANTSNVLTTDQGEDRLLASSSVLVGAGEQIDKAVEQSTSAEATAEHPPHNGDRLGPDQAARRSQDLSIVDTEQNKDGLETDMAANEEVRPEQAAQIINGSAKSTAKGRGEHETVKVQFDGTASGSHQRSQPRQSTRDLNLATTRRKNKKEVAGKTPVKADKFVTSLFGQSSKPDEIEMEDSEEGAWSWSSGLSETQKNRSGDRRQPHPPKKHAKFRRVYTVVDREDSRDGLEGYESESTVATTVSQDLKDVIAEKIVAANEMMRGPNWMTLRAPVIHLLNDVEWLFQNGTSKPQGTREMNKSGRSPGKSDGDRKHRHPDRYTSFEEADNTSRRVKAMNATAYPAKQNAARRPSYNPYQRPPPISDVPYQTPHINHYTPGRGLFGFYDGDYPAEQQPPYHGGHQTEFFTHPRRAPYPGMDQAGYSTGGPPWYPSLNAGQPQDHSPINVNVPYYGENQYGYYNQNLEKEKVEREKAEREKFQREQKEREDMERARKEREEIERLKRQIEEREKMEREKMERVQMEYKHRRDHATERATADKQDSSSSRLYYKTTTTRTTEAFGPHGDGSSRELPDEYVRHLTRHDTREARKPTSPRRSYRYAEGPEVIEFTRSRSRTPSRTPSPNSDRSPPPRERVRETVIRQSSMSPPPPPANRSSRHKIILRRMARGSSRSPDRSHRAMVRPKRRSIYQPTVQDYDSEEDYGRGRERYR